MNARERIMRVIAQGGRFTIPSLVDAAPASYESTSRLVWELARAGVMRCIEPKRNGVRGGAALYEVMHNTPEERQRRPSGRARMWLAMRMLRRFTLPDICATAEVEDNNALQFTRSLMKGGFLRCEVPRRSGVTAGSAMYALAIDAGPMAPQVRRDGEIHDPNKA